MMRIIIIIIIIPRSISTQPMWVMLPSIIDVCVPWFVVIIVVRGTAGVAVVSVVVIDDVVASVVTELIETDDSVVAWDTLSVFSFKCPVVSVVSVLGLAVDDAISRI